MYRPAQPRLRQQRSWLNVPQELSVPSLRAHQTLSPLIPIADPSAHTSPHSSSHQALVEQLLVSSTGLVT